MNNLLDILTKNCDNVVDEGYNKIAEKISKFTGAPKETIMPVLKEVIDKKAEERVNQLLKEKNPIEIMGDLISGNNQEMFKTDVEEIVKAVAEVLSKLNVVDMDDTSIKKVDIDPSTFFEQDDIEHENAEDLIEENEEEEVIVKTICIDTKFLKETIDSGKKVQVVLEFI